MNYKFKLGSINVEVPEVEVKLQLNDIQVEMEDFSVIEMSNAMKEIMVTTKELFVEGAKEFHNLYEEQKETSHTIFKLRRELEEANECIQELKAKNEELEINNMKLETQTLMNVLSE